MLWWMSSTGSNYTSMKCNFLFLFFTCCLFSCTLKEEVGPDYPLHTSEGANTVALKFQNTTYFTSEECSSGGFFGDFESAPVCFSSDWDNLRVFGPSFWLGVDFHFKRGAGNYELADSTYIQGARLNIDGKQFYTDEDHVGILTVDPLPPDGSYYSGKIEEITFTSDDGEEVSVYDVQFDVVPGY